mgnify:CR=1 FL=1
MAWFLPLSKQFGLNGSAKWVSLNGFLNFKWFGLVFLMNKWFSLVSRPTNRTEPKPNWAHCYIGFRLNDLKVFIYRCYYSQDSYLLAYG